MKKVNYKGVELEAYDSSTVTSYNEVGECQIKFNVVYKLDNLTFSSLDKVDKYLINRYKVMEYNGVDIYRILGRDKDSVVYGSKCSVNTYDSINEVRISIDLYNFKHKILLDANKPFTFDAQKHNPKFKMEVKIENDNCNSTSDNRLAIRMLNSVSEIISEIERDNEDMIELNLNELKTRVSQFEKVFQDNKQKGMYR